MTNQERVSVEYMDAAGRTRSCKCNAYRNADGSFTVRITAAMAARIETGDSVAINRVSLGVWLKRSHSLSATRTVHYIHVQDFSVPRPVDAYLHGKTH